MNTMLCVDDEPNITSALRRVFRSSGYRMLVANSGEQALQILGGESVDLVISDMRMPIMDGAQLLEQVRTRWPHTTRLLLTGHADTASTVAAINRGEVYRYISKPWNDDDLLLTVQQAFERQALEREAQRLQVLTAQQNQALSDLNASLEKRVEARTEDLSLAHERLKKTYMTTIKVFSNLLELRGGKLVGHGRRVADLARRTALAVGLSEPDALTVFIAGLLHDIGHMGLSDELLARPVPRLNDEELGLYRKHPTLGEQALLALDDLQPAASLIRSHHERHDGKGYPDALAGPAIPLGARILALADTYDDLQNRHLSSASLSDAEARQILARGRGTQFDPEVLDVFLQTVLHSTSSRADRLVPKTVDELQPGMVLGRELMSPDGSMLLAVDQAFSADLIERVRRYSQRNDLQWVLYVDRDACPRAA